MKKVLIATVAVAALATPALADFWIVQDTSTKRCPIVEQKPTATTMTVVGGDGKVYKTRVEADSALKTEKICETTTGGPAPAPR
jgi:hypothetical protein